MSEIELVVGDEYLFCIEGRWRLGVCGEPEDDGKDTIYDFLVAGNFHFYNIECTAIIPLALALRAGELQAENERLTAALQKSLDDGDVVDALSLAGCDDVMQAWQAALKGSSDDES